MRRVTQVRQGEIGNNSILHPQTKAMNDIPPHVLLCTWCCLKATTRHNLADYAAYPAFSLVSQRHWALLHHRYLFGTDLSDYHPEVVHRLAMCWQSVVMMDGCRLGHLAIDALSLGSQYMQLIATVRHSGLVLPQALFPAVQSRNRSAFGQICRPVHARAILSAVVQHTGSGGLVEGVPSLYGTRTDDVAPGL